MALDDSAPVLNVPLTGRVPLQAPEAVHEVAFVEDQVSVELPPLETLVGLALIVTVGAAAETVTVADCDAVPPAPVQVRVYLVVVVSAEVLWEPLIGSLPAQPPEAVQAVALVEDQLSVEAAPFCTVLGLAVKVTAGVGAVIETVAACDALPPLPVQVSIISLIRRYRSRRL